MQIFHYINYLKVDEMMHNYLFFILFTQMTHKLVSIKLVLSFIYFFNESNAYNKKVAYLIIDSLCFSNESCIISVVSNKKIGFIKVLKILSKEKKVLKIGR